jgi:hypothetical protein
MKKWIFAITAMVAFIALSIVTSEPALSIAWAPVAFERNLFKGAQDWAKSKLGISDPNWQPSYLRVENTLVNGTGLYNFNIKVESGQIATERKLDRNDIFCLTHFMVYILCEYTAEVGKANLQTYPNQFEFVGTTNFDPLDMGAIYNGYLEIKTEQTVNAESVPMVKFLHIPETQKSAATNFSKWDIGEHAYYPGNVFFFKGSSSIEIKVNFPTWSGQTTQTTTSGRSNKLVFHPYGFLLKSATVKL